MKQPEAYFNYDNESEVKTLFLRAYPRLMSYARGLLGKISFVSAEDVVNDVFYKFLNKKPQVSRSGAESYIFTMVRNESLNLLKRTKAEKNISLEEISTLQSIDNITALDFFASQPDRPLKDLIIDEVLGFCVQLPPRTAEVFKLSRIEGLKNAEIASRLGISQRAVEKHISISITRYREAFLHKIEGSSSDANFNDALLIFLIVVSKLPM